MKWAVCLAVVALSAPAQGQSVALTNRLGTGSNDQAGIIQNQRGPNLAEAQRVEQIRAACIQSRRRICGKILQVTPDGLVIDSGYTNLMREPLNRSWLVPGTAAATRATNVIEANQPGSVCLGLVFLTEIPRKPDAKPRLYDYVNLEAFPAGQYTWTSVGDVQRPLRRFSTKIEKAIEWRLDETGKQKTPVK